MSLDFNDIELRLEKVVMHVESVLPEELFVREELQEVPTLLPRPKISE